MKSAAAAVVACLVWEADASQAARKGWPHSAFLARTTRLLFGGVRPVARYGDPACPCIGFDRISGETVVRFEDFNATENSTNASIMPPLGMAPAPVALLARRALAKSAQPTGVQVSYPADLGAHCEAWDAGRHPECTGDAALQPKWCGDPWCYVDPCKCDIPTLPKPSGYVPDARYRGAPLYFSYAACGAKDAFSVDMPEVGHHKCKCIGLDDVPGTIKVTLSGFDKPVSFPGELGSTCKAWDAGTNPECLEDSPPAWCSQRWCYVDPCSCDIDELPTVTMYLPKALYQGKSLFYSYDTCGSKDHYTETENTEACQNQGSKQACMSKRFASGSNKCAWTGTECLGWEIVHHPLCQHMTSRIAKRSAKASASSARPFAWVLLALLALTSASR